LQNPISQLGVIATRNSLAQNLSELSGTPENHIRALNNATAGEGEPSLQNALEVAGASLALVPRHGVREILIVYSGLNTCDPGDILASIQKLCAQKIRVSMVGVGAEMYIGRRITEETHGTYTIAVDAQHYSEVLRV
jgi:transcription initiation factor TFIIH subunit 2